MRCRGCHTQLKQCLWSPDFPRGQLFIQVQEKVARQLMLYGKCNRQSALRLERLWQLRKSCKTKGTRTEIAGPSKHCGIQALLLFHHRQGWALPQPGSWVRPWNSVPNRKALQSHESAHAFSVCETLHLPGILLGPLVPDSTTCHQIYCKFLSLQAVVSLFSIIYWC